MKQGDKFPVTMAGETVAEASVKEINEEAKTVTLIVPATLVTMSYRTHDELTPADPVQETPAAEGASHVLLTDEVVKPADLATSQVPGQENPAPNPQDVPNQPATAPTPAQEPVVPAVPEEVQDAVEQKATEQ